MRDDFTWFLSELRLKPPPHPTMRLIGSRIVARRNSISEDKELGGVPPLDRQTLIQEFELVVKHQGQSFPRNVAG